jgi:cation:H+ antiporter
MAVLHSVCTIFAPKINTPMDILLLVGGLLLILLGANGLTDGAASVAKRFRIPSIVIGLTIVAFGTSAPELTVSISSALKGSADIAIGNVVGSNIFNTLMIVGCTALFAPIVITRNTLKREIPLCILSSVALLICANDVFLDGSEENMLGIADGLLLLCFFAIFLSYTFAIAKRDGNTTNPEKEPLQEEDEIRLLPVWKSALYILGGLAGLIIGGNFFVDGAGGIARGLGVSESVIGLTLVAGGTSLPELATSIVAALKKNPEIAIGNAIGSNLFNIFFVLGCSASITPMRLTGITNLDLWVLVGAGILLWLFGLFFGKRTITRIEGSILMLCYAAYMAVLICNL